MASLIPTVETKYPFSPYPFIVPVDLLQEGEFLFQGTTRILFDGFGYHTCSVLWWEHHKKMDMVLFDSDFNVFLIWIIFENLLEGETERVSHHSDQDFLSIPGDPYDMILGFIY